MKKIEPSKSKKETCKRCGMPYPVPEVMVCPCHPMFSPDYNWDDEGYIDMDGTNIKQVWKDKVDGQVKIMTEKGIYTLTMEPNLSKNL